MKSTYLDCLAAYGASGAHPGCLTLTKRLINGMKLDREADVLDVGCGTGQTAAYLAESSKAQVTALDLHPLMVEKARKRLENQSVRVIQGSVEALPFHKEQFDLVLSESVLAFTKLDRSLAEIYRILKDDGVLLAIEMVLETELPEDERHQLQAFYGIPKLRAAKEWQQVIEAAGFSHIKMEKWQENQKEAEPTEDDTPEFILSEQISEENADALETHMQLKTAYEKELGVRIFHCYKS